ncbi:MAG: hypothetical protein Kow0092_26960 [Deferrisomatales bacterium]
MCWLGKVVQALSAGAGFFAGYLWAVQGWAGSGSGGAAVTRAALADGVLLAALYTGLLSGLFWPCLPVPRTSGLRVVVSPASFTLSFLLGAGGMWAALGALR